MLQIALTILIYLILVIPAGVYVYHIAAGKHTFADPVFNRVDGAIYKVCGVNPKNGMNWKKYAVSLVITNGIMILLGYIIRVLACSIPMGSERWRNPFPLTPSSAL